MKGLLIFTLAVLVVIDLLARFDAPPPLPIVRADWVRTDQNPDLLFAPCPKSPHRNIPFKSKREA